MKILKKSLNKSVRIMKISADVSVNMAQNLHTYKSEIMLKVFSSFVYYDDMTNIVSNSLYLFIPHFFTFRLHARSNYMALTKNCIIICQRHSTRRKELSAFR